MLNLGPEYDLTNEIGQVYFNFWWWYTVNQYQYMRTAKLPWPQFRNIFVLRER
jgi:hypothetical protein